MVRQMGSYDHDYALAVRGERMNRNMSASACARQLGITPVHMSDIESARRRPSKALAERIYNLLGVEPLERMQARRYNELLLRNDRLIEALHAMVRKFGAGNVYLYSSLLRQPPIPQVECLFCHAKAEERPAIVHDKLCPVGVLIENGVRP